MGILYIKPNGSIDSDTPGIEDVPKMTLSFTPSDIALEAVKDVTAGADISTTNEPILSALYNIPDSVTAGKCRLIIRTAYGSGTRINKTVRTDVYAETVSIA